MELKKDYQSIMNYLKELERTYKEAEDFTLGHGSEKEWLNFLHRRKTVSLIIFELEMLTTKED